MAHYAYVDENNTVTQVIVGLDEGTDGKDWEVEYGAIRTSYNTRGGVHYDEFGEPSADQSKAFRFNYAGIGMLWDPDFGPDGAFYWPQPHPSWALNPDTAEWDPPSPRPDGQYEWDESSLSWLPLPSPFPSWVWEDGFWNPPVEYPEDGNMYNWDEESASWIPATVSNVS